MSFVNLAIGELKGAGEFTAHTTVNIYDNVDSALSSKLFHLLTFNLALVELNPFTHCPFHSGLIYTLMRSNTETVSIFSQVVIETVTGVLTKQRVLLIYTNNSKTCVLYLHKTHTGK